MTGPSPDERLEELSRKIESLPSEPPITPRPNVWVSVVRTVCELVALIGILFLVVGLNNARIASCEADNEFRLEVAGVLFDSQRPNASPEEKKFLELQIARFSLVDCKNPSEVRTRITRDMTTSIARPTTTTTSTTISGP